MLGFNTPKLDNKLRGQAVELSDMLFGTMLKSVQKATTAQPWSSLVTWLGWAAAAASCVSIRRLRVIPLKRSVAKGETRETKTVFSYRLWSCCCCKLGRFTIIFTTAWSWSSLSCTRLKMWPHTAAQMYLSFSLSACRLSQQVVMNDTYAVVNKPKHAHQPPSAPSYSAVPLSRSSIGSR